MAKSKKEKFKYKVQDVVFYIGGLYDEYKNQKCEILNRASKRGLYNYYGIQFEDGFKMSCVKEHLLVEEVDVHD